MPSAPLPKRIRYLQPAYERLAKLLKKHSSNELPDNLFEKGSWLEKIVRTHIADHSDKDACSLLQGDLDAIQEYSSQRRGVDESVWGSLHGWLMGFMAWGMYPDSIPYKPKGKQSDTKLPVARVEWEIPEGFKVTYRRQGRLTMRNKNLTGTLCVKSNSDADGLDWILDETIRMIRVLPGTACAQSSSVRFGKVRGKKWIHITTRPKPSKDVIYLLSAPGGNVEEKFTLIESYDEKIIESKLPTLRLVKMARQ